jgi:hypothetical protein
MDSVNLVWRTRTDAGWKYFPVVVGRNGRIKKGAVKVDGQEVSYPDGHFEIRYYEDRRTKYKNVGTDATKAVNERDRMHYLGEARTAASSAGVAVIEPELRKTIKVEAARFVKAELADVGLSISTPFSCSDYFAGTVQPGFTPAAAFC